MGTLSWVVWVGEIKSHESFLNSRRGRKERELELNCEKDVLTFEEE